MPISTATTTFSPLPPEQPKAPSSLMGKDDFLKLLVAQLKHQDPTAPSDMNAMTEQMTQFGILEQLTNLAKAGEATRTSLERTHAVDLLGKTVTYEDAQGSLVTGKVEKVTTSGDAPPTLTVAGKAGVDPKALVGVA